MPIDDRPDRRRFSFSTFPSACSLRLATASMSAVVTRYAVAVTSASTTDTTRVRRESARHDARSVAARADRPGKDAGGIEECCSAGRRLATSYSGPPRARYDGVTAVYAARRRRADNRQLERELPPDASRAVRGIRRRLRYCPMQPVSACVLQGTRFHCGSARAEGVVPTSSPSRFPACA